MYSNPEETYQTSQGETYLTLEKDAERNLFYLKWAWKYEYGFEVAQAGCLAAVEFVKKHELIGGISDVTGVQGTWDPINEWLATEWVPQVLKAGVKFWVHILPKEFFAQLSAELMENDMNLNGLMAPNVDNLEKAYHWIEMHR